MLFPDNDLNLIVFPQVRAEIMKRHNRRVLRRQSCASGRSSRASFVFSSRLSEQSDAGPRRPSDPPSKPASNGLRGSPKVTSSNNVFPKCPMKPRFGKREDKNKSKSRKPRRSSQRKTLIPGEDERGDSYQMKYMYSEAKDLDSSPRERDRKVVVQPDVTNVTTSARPLVMTSETYSQLAQSPAEVTSNNNNEEELIAMTIIRENPGDRGVGRSEDDLLHGEVSAPVAVSVLKNGDFRPGRDRDPNHVRSKYAGEGRQVKFKDIISENGLSPLNDVSEEFSDSSQIMVVLWAGVVDSDTLLMSHLYSGLTLLFCCFKNRGDKSIQVD